MKPRPAIPNDFDSILTFIRACNQADYGETFMTDESLHKWWQGLELARDTWLITTSDSKLAAYADLNDFWISLYTNDLTHARTLLRHAETRAKALSTGTMLTARVSARNAIAKQVYEEAGFNLTYTFLIMEIVMTAAPETPQWPTGITVRPFIKGQDDHATYETDEAASQDKGYYRALTFDDWKQRMNFDKMDPTLWFLACQGEQIVGVALNVYAEPTKTGWIDHLGVRREWRGQGLGKALMLHSFQQFYDRGITRLKLSVDSKSLTNAPRLYERVGMQTIQEYHIYKKELSAAESR